MKRIVVIAMALLGTAALAQSQATPPPSDGRTGNVNTTAAQIENSPSYKDLYCAGFITKEAITNKNQIAGGEYSPEATLYVRGGTVFINGGGLQQGERYSVVRELKDPDRFEPYKGAHSILDATGQPYAEIGQIRVVSLRGEVAVAQVEYSCQNMTIGDIVVPFREHPPVNYRKTQLERFPPDPGHLTARIVMGREFDQDVGRGQIVYINAGADKGIKLGDYFRAVRSYDPKKINEIDAVSNMAPIGEDTQKHPGQMTAESAAKLPMRAVGEMIVINVTPTASTALITRSFEDIEIGDYVQLEGE
ncbi:MAG TPA: hypothetical protein VMU28_04180 [Terriglobales bacterium]|nr:hypothetical protein [Terriglobales bacterium]